jgi:hypothetical protein
MWGYVPSNYPPAPTRFVPRYPVVTQGWGGYGDAIGLPFTAATPTTAAIMPMTVAAPTYTPGFGPGIAIPVMPAPGGIAPNTMMPSPPMGWDPALDWTGQDVQLYPDAFEARRKARDARMQAMIQAQMPQQQRGLPLWGWALVAAVGYALYRSFRKAA